MIVVAEPDFTIRKSIINSRLVGQCATCHWIETFTALPEAQAAAEAHMKNAHNFTDVEHVMIDKPVFETIEAADEWAATVRGIYGTSRE